MAKIIDQLKTISITTILTVLVSGLVTMLVTIWLSIRDPMADIVISTVPKSVVVILPLLLLSSLILAVSYIFYLRNKLKDKLFISFGIYWDNNLNPYCPTCQKLLSNYALYKDASGHSRPGLFCINCKHVVRISDGETIFMAIDEAKDKLQRLRKTTSANKAKTVK